MDTSRTFTFESPARLIYGVGASERVGEEAVRLGAARVLVVTDAGLLKTGIPETIAGCLGKAGVASVVFGDVEPNPGIDTVDKAFARYQEGGCDGIVAVGGGSPIDVAKAVGILASHGGAITDFYYGGAKVKVPLPPFVAVPTTCGTGSEVTFFTVITDRKQKFKMGIGSPLNVPRVAILDPSLLAKLPSHLVASTGLDALTHAVESYTNLNSQPISDALDIQAVRVVAQSLRVAVANGNLSALGDMLLASTMAGMGFTNTRLGIVHAMSHAVGGHADVPHGVANAILLPVCMEFNLIGNPRKYADIAEAMGEPIDGLSLMDAAWQSVEAVRRLCQDLRIPETLREVGVTEGMIDPMADDTLKAANALLNPRRVTKREVIDLYRQAMG